MRIAISLLVLAVIPASHALAQELPSRRAGLWEITMSEEGKKAPPQVMQQCIDAKTDQMMQAFGTSMGAEMCSKHDIKKVGATIVIDAECQVGPMRSVTHSVVSGDFNSAYTVRVTTKVEGMPAKAQAMAGGTRVIQARWTGACTAGQRAGDMVMPDGRTINILDTRKRLENIKARRPPAPH